MPKRIVDGEALWTSGKLKRVPVEFRTHYANWIPLAEANGVFEVDFDIIKSKVYPILKPDFSTENVQELFGHFVMAGLLLVWKERGKTWAYFVGIGKSGRLPVETHLKRYKNLPPSPPSVPDNPGLSGNTPEGFGSGLVLDRFGMDVVPDQSGTENEADMSIRNNIIDKSRAILGVRIGPQDSNWTEIKALVRVYGEQSVEDKFEQWAKSQTQIPNYPLSGFVRVADALLSGKFSSSVSPEDLSGLVNELTRISDNRAVFNNKHRAAIAEQLARNTPEDIKSVFQEYWNNVSGNEFKEGNAAREFTEAIESLLYTQAKRREEARRAAEMVARCTENEQRIAAEEARKALEDDVKLRDLEEDTLPTENFGQQ